jgi:hypothetical protein
MVALSLVSSVAPSAETEVNGNPSGKSPGEFPGRPIDLWAMERVLRDQWPAFCRAHFRNTTDCAAAMQVDERTARAWWEGVSVPRSAVMLCAVARYPEQIAAIIRRAA